MIRTGSSNVNFAVGCQLEWVQIEKPQFAPGSIPSHTRTYLHGAELPVSLVGVANIPLTIDSSKAHIAYSAPSHRSAAIIVVSLDGKSPRIERK